MILSKSLAFGAKAFGRELDSHIDVYNTLTEATSSISKE